MPIRGGQACQLTVSRRLPGQLLVCGKVPLQRAPLPVAPPACIIVKFGVVRGLSSDHSGLGSMTKLIFSVIVTPACAADTETQVLLACGTPEHGFPLFVRHVSVCGGQVFLQILVVLAATNHAEVVAGGSQGMFRGGVPHPANEGGQPARLCGGGLLCGSRRRAAGRVHLRTCDRCESGGMRVGSVGIHDYVVVVCGLNEELHEEPARPAVVASPLVQACNLIVLVHGSHLPATRGKVRVPGGSTFMQNCVKRSRELAYLM